MWWGWRGAREEQDDPRERCRWIKGVSSCALNTHLALLSPQQPCSPAEDEEPEISSLRLSLLLVLLWLQSIVVLFQLYSLFISHFQPFFFFMTSMTLTCNPLYNQWLFFCTTKAACVHVFPRDGDRWVCLITPFVSLSSGVYFSFCGVCLTPKRRLRSPPSREPCSMLRYYCRS